MRSAWILLLFLGSCAIAACAMPAAPSQSAAAGLQLRVAPADLGCDAMGVPYRSATFKVDPFAADPVTAVTDQGASLRTFWSAGFEGGPATDPVVRDPAGQIVAADGDVLTIPEGEWPRLKGYFVCPSADALYVLLADPA